MTYDEITLWRRFMQAKGILNNFEYLYRANRYKEIDLTEHLEEIDAEDVIMSSFNQGAAVNTIFGPKYWQNIDKKWQEKLADYRETGNMGAEPSIVMCLHCQRMLPYTAFAYKSNGTLHKHCKECESGEWDRRRKEREKGIGKLDETSKVCGHCGKRKSRTQFDVSATSADGLQSYCKQCQEELLEMAEQAHDNNEQDVDMPIAPRLGEHDVTMHFKVSEKRLTLNSVLSAAIRDAHLTKCNLETDRQGRQFLVFNNTEGSNVTNANSRGGDLLQVCSASICRQIGERFSLRIGDNYYLHITSNLAHLKDIINVEIKQVRTREEYAVIVANREAATTRVPVTAAPSEPKPSVQPQAQPAGINLSKCSPQQTLQQLVDRNHISEHDMAVFLYNKGWKLQEPVVVTTHKKFSL